MRLVRAMLAFYVNTSLIDFFFESCDIKFLIFYVST